MSEPIRFAEPIPVGEEEVIGPTLLRYISELQRQAANAEALRLQLSRARGYLMAITNTSYKRPDATWMQFHRDEWDEATRGLTEFLKEVGGGG